MLGTLTLILTTALGALPTVAIQGRVQTPDGTALTSGIIRCSLSQPASVLDGATSQRVASAASTTLAADGTVTWALVPNDVMTPAGTAYSCTIAGIAAGRGVSWTETWQLASTPSPISIGAIPRLSTAPPVAGSYVGTAPSYTATAASGSPAFLSNSGAYWCFEPTCAAARLSWSGTNLTSLSIFSAPSYFGDSLQGQSADGATAVAVKVGSLVTYSTAGAKLLSVRNNVTEQISIGYDGTLTQLNGISSLRYLTVVGYIRNSGTYFGPYSTSWLGQSSVADSGSAVSAVFDTDNVFSATGAKLLSVRNHAVEQAYVDKDGGYAWRASPTLATCAAGFEGLVSRQAGGTSGARTKLCMCTSDGQASPSYAWKNITTVFASEAASVGTSTTCP